MRELLKNKRFALFWAGQTVSALGNWINFVGLNLYVYKVFGSGKILGLFLVFRMLPAVLFGSVGGYLSDRFNRKKLMITCDVIRALLVLGFLFTKNLYAFYAIGLLLSALDKVFISARGSFLPNIVKKEKLMDANSLNEMTASVVTVIGPAVGAMLVGFFTFHHVFVIDSATFVISVLCVSLISYIPPEQKPKHKKGIIGEFIDEYKTAFKFLAGHGSMLFLMMLRITDAVGSGAYNIALPIFSKSTKFEMWKWGASSKGAAYGWLVGIWAMGQFTGSYLSKKISNKFNLSPENVFSVSITIMAIGMGLTFHAEVLPIALLAIFLGGIGDGISNVIFTTMLMKDSPDDMRGKLFGTIISLVYSAVAVGMLAGGRFVDYYPLKTITNYASIMILAGIVIGRIALFYKKRFKNRKMEENDG